MEMKKETGRQINSNVERDARERENIDENKGDRDIQMKSYREM